ncbi:unnamed protein product [Bursaphelenchus xylophilus]|uniref:(pine wood nematode) hypothetical protein n=1 Tax=Bursaphelenchus xylophilus TaxID=6326 RepID=A0A7I8XMK3_BURXY|nr:unnamed protein product [Bursaphelenchus xylophilus]CAG9121920.1 unnamed protein product [Bursaphelenchus xylophilus]
MSNSTTFSPTTTESSTASSPPSTTPFNSDPFNDDFSYDIALEVIVNFVVTTILEYLGKVIITTMVALISYQVYSHLIYPFIFPCYKIGYHNTLRRLKFALEQGIPEELQTNKRVVKRYLKLYHEFCKLRIMARRDYLGIVDTKDATWAEFDSLNFKKGAKLFLIM